MGRGKNLLLIFLLFPREGIGTQHYRGCQDFIGPFPSVFLDKCCEDIHYLYIMAQQRKKMDLSDLGGLVYSTGSLPKSEELTSDPLAHGEQNLRVWLEKNHRGGKIACVIKGYVGSDDELNELAKFLKTKCGTGGSAKDGEIVIQGDHREKIVQLLLDRGADPTIGE